MSPDQQNNTAPTLEMLETELARAQRRKNVLLSAFAIAAIVVSLSVAFALRQGGKAKVHEEQVLACNYSGVAAHMHNELCYDMDGNLVCTMPEHELHVHTDECYDEEGNLICDLDDYTHEHVHGAGCFETIIVEDEEPEDEYVEEEVSEPETLGDPVVDYDEGAPEVEADSEVIDTTTNVDTETVVTEEENVVEEISTTMPSQQFQTEILDDYNNPIVVVTVDAPEGAFPEKTAMQVEIVTDDEIEEVVNDVVASQTTGKVVGLQSVDITFYDEYGMQIQPQKPVTVKIASDLIENGEADLIVYVNEAGEGQVVNAMEQEELFETETFVEYNEVAFETEDF